MTGYEISAIDLEPRLASATAVGWYTSSSRPPLPLPESRVEDDAVLPENDDPWFEEDEFDADDSDSSPKRPFWNR